MSDEAEEILDLLIKEKYISEKELKKAEKAAEKTQTPLLNYLIENNYLNMDLIGQAIAEHFGVPYVDLNTNQPTAEQVLMIPEKIAKGLNAVLYSSNDEEIVIVSDHPLNPQIQALLRPLFPNKNIKTAYSLNVDIGKAFSYYKLKLSSRFENIISLEKKVAPEMMAEVIKDAFDLNASDIHFEPRGEEVFIRFRIDGILHEVGQISSQYYDNIINYMKVLASLRIDEHRAAQDGAIRFANGDINVDIRLSIVPVVAGEKSVLRILSRHIGDLSIDNLGLSGEDQKIFEAAIAKPFGMIVVSGPTGSGKTTTLYTLVKKISNPEINITSIEDPVEYMIDGANQIQVNLAAGVTFAKGLRSIVRQDPDVILVGEIRDRETAEISVNAALTGHLLFSTFHANNAATTFLRLADMGIERYLLASTLDLVVSQRLLRRICEKCRYSLPVSEAYLSKFPADFAGYIKKNPTIYQGKGCPSCKGTGYKGRIAAFEMIRVTPEIQGLILSNATSREIWETAKKQGSRSLFEDASDKAKMGTTTFDEVFRVAPPAS